MLAFFLILKQKWKKFFLNKLVRDNATSIDGSICSVKKLGYGKFLYFLKKKLIEEAIEVNTSTNKKEMIEELADVFDVFNNILSEYNISMSVILEQSIKKQQEKGNFSKKLLLEYCDVKEDDPKFNEFNEKYKRQKYVMIDENNIHENNINKSS